MNRLFSLLNFKVFILVLFLVINFNINSVNSQNKPDDDIVPIDPVALLTDLIKYSNAVIKNNLNHDGQIYGYINGERIFIKDIGSDGIVSIETQNFDSIQFYSEFNLEDGSTYIVDGFFLKVIENQPFDIIISPIKEVVGGKITVDNKELVNIIEEPKMLYLVKITDDVNTGQIEVTPLEKSSPNIEILKIDSSTYHIKLKARTKNEFAGSISDDQMIKWRKGEEVKFPIGVKITDKYLLSDFREIDYVLVKKKKPKKKSN